MFGIQTVGSIYQYGQQKNAVRARNRAKLQNFNVENEQYIADNILRNVDWKNSVLNSEINIDNLFKQASQVWQAQDLAIQGAYDRHAFNNVDILTKMYESEGAREQTGVTAQRISNESIRKAGFALTKSWQDLIFAKDQAQLQKETTRIEANQKRRDAWQQIRQAPVPGATPIAPQLEGDPSMGGLLLNIAMSAASSWLMGTQLKELKSMKDALAKGTEQVIQSGTQASGQLIAQQGTTVSLQSQKLLNFSQAVNQGKKLTGSLGTYAGNLGKRLNNSTLMIIPK